MAGIFSPTALSADYGALDLDTLMRQRLAAAAKAQDENLARQYIGKLLMSMGGTPNQIPTSPAPGQASRPAISQGAGQGQPQAAAPQAAPGAAIGVPGGLINAQGQPYVANGDRAQGFPVPANQPQQQGGYQPPSANVAPQSAERADRAAPGLMQIPTIEQFVSTMRQMPGVAQHPGAMTDAYDWFRDLQKDAYEREYQVWKHQTDLDAKDAQRADNLFKTYMVLKERYDSAVLRGEDTKEVRRMMNDTALELGRLRSSTQEDVARISAGARVESAHIGATSRENVADIQAQGRRDVAGLQAASRERIAKMGDDLRRELGERRLDLKETELTNTKTFQNRKLDLMQAGLDERTADLQARKDIAAARDATIRRGQDLTMGDRAAARTEKAREFDVTDTTKRRGQDITTQIAQWKLQAQKEIEDRKWSLEKDKFEVLQSYKDRVLQLKQEGMDQSEADRQAKRDVEKAALDIKQRTANEKTEQLRQRDVKTLDLVMDDIDQAVSSAQTLLAHPGLETAVGPIASRAPTLRGDSANFLADLHTLKSQILLGGVARMRTIPGTTGFGRVTNFEAQTLQNAVAALDESQTPEQFRTNLQKLVKVLNNTKGRVSQAYREQYSTKESAPLSSDAQAQPLPDDRSKLQKGTLYKAPNGQLGIWTGNTFQLVGE